MIDRGKQDVLGIQIDAVDYDAAVARIIEAARERRGYGCTALAVHGVMTGFFDPQHRGRLNALDLVTPDGQPVRWGLNYLHRAGLPDRVYGPTLTLKVCEAAAAAGLSVFLFGSRDDVVGKLADSLGERFPGLKIAGIRPSTFRRLERDEWAALMAEIRDSGAAITLVGLGCPRQEVFAYEAAGDLSMPVLAVGAAFDYHSGELKEPPEWMQRSGLQWLYRLGQDPRRLWKRYLKLNPTFLAMLAAQRLKLWKPKVDPGPPADRLQYG